MPASVSVESRFVQEILLDPSSGSRCSRLLNIVFSLKSCFMHIDLRTKIVIKNDRFSVIQN